ncbi:HXXXD-type acyl-transferase family protein [Striga asiatica]|uniref:HXXXD-type acyl-transferase family protein n=1 Tax=Striga asiatica TaxID=4170 RepID=A0A5A7QTI9_STRAF|nr:HXXXD-type acyl-transferase family protein [Striga asiatica]
MTAFIEICRVGPPPDSAAKCSLPLTYQDIFWLHFHPIRRLLFYDLSCSKPEFSDNLVPKLKHSLARVLKQYFPLAGKIVYPSDTSEEDKPVIRFEPGDSVPLAIFESNDDFDLLVGNQPREADSFYDYIPQLPDIAIDSSGRKLLKLLALQVTLFPGRGVCIGIANHHAAGDASSIVGFIRAWASTCKLDRARESHEDYSLPVFDRSMIKDPRGFGSFIWNRAKRNQLTLSPFPLPTKRVRATYIVSRAQIEKLKDLVSAEVPSFVHLSSFVVTSAYAWTCLAKSLSAVEEEEKSRVGGNDDVEFFMFTADIRARVDPPVPGNYFGNFLSGGLGRARNGELVGPGGFVLAARVIAEQVKHVVNDKDRVLERLEDRIEEIGSIVGKRVFSVSGSNRVDLYGADFGFGRARKVETLSIDGEKYAMSICKPRDFEGGLEIGLSLPKAVMDVFAGLFSDGLKP